MDKILFFGAASIIAWLLILFFSKEQKFLEKLGNYILLTSLLIITGYLLLVITYGFSYTYLDHAESNIAAVSWLLHNGKPLYPPLDSAERYINNYGPILYIFNGFLLDVFSPSILSSKLLGIISSIATLLFVFNTITRTSNYKIAIICCAYLVISLLTLNRTPAASFWARPDPLILASTSFGLMGITCSNPIISVVVTSISLGISLNLKVTAILYFLPIFVILYLRTGIFHTLSAMAGSALVGVAPFLLFHQISLSNYLVWLQQVGKKGIAIDQVAKNIFWILYVAFPLIIILVSLAYLNRQFFNQFIWKNRYYIFSLLFSIFSVSIIGAKQGAIQNNMLPFLPFILYLIALASDILITKSIEYETKEQIAFGKLLEFRKIVAGLLLSLFLSILFPAFYNSSGILMLLGKSSGHQAIEEIRNIIKTYPGMDIQMGYGEDKNYPLSFYRPELVYKGNSYWLDPVSMMEMLESGTETIPPKTLLDLNSCKSKIWLIPKNEKPFELLSYYPPFKPLFSNEFKTIFLKQYSRKFQTSLYEAWVCKNS